MTLGYTFFCYYVYKRVRKEKFVMSGKLSDADAKAFVEYYQPLYFKDATSEKIEEKLGSDSGLNRRTERDVEKYIVEELGKYKNSDYKIQKEFVAWKSGELKGVHLPDKTDEQGVMREPEPLGDISIDRNKIIYLDEYIEKINKSIEKLRSSLDDNDVEETYTELLGLQNLSEDKKVKTFGSVYIITLIYFLSGGRYPIYDQYAHKAVKALYSGINPKSIYVGSAPDKSKSDAVMAMYKEYLFLLKGVFGTYHISREQDQALWVYGHSQKGYKDAPDIGFKDFK
jgi:hypothetical protein